MKATTTILLLMFFFPLNAQRFSNQGREEDYRAKRLFKEKYSKHYYERFSGNISVIDEDTIKYDDEVLIISNINKELKAIFTKGIFLSYYNHRSCRKRDSTKERTGFNVNSK